MERKSQVFHSLLLMFVVFIFAMAACASIGTIITPASLTVKPDKTVLSPALFKEPIVFRGSGWEPNEMVVANLIIPPDVKVKSVDGDEVGIATGKADAKGNLEVKVEALSLLMTFFQTGWNDDTMKPDFKKATPLPPREYKVRAVGLESERMAETRFTLLAPPKKQ